MAKSVIQDVGAPRGAIKRPKRAVEPKLTPEAIRALAEAQARRAAEANLKASGSQLPEEIGGRGGLEPTRYGDWESKGIASDF